MEKCKYDTGTLSYHGPCYQCALGILRGFRGENCPYRNLWIDHLDSTDRFFKYFESIRVALQEVREYRDSGEPAKSDREEIERLVERSKNVQRLADAVHAFKVASRTASGDRIGAHREMLDALHDLEGGRRKEEP